MTTTEAIASVKLRRGTGRELKFHLSDPSDVIQRHHARGHFYSETQLLRHANFIIPRRAVIDVGSNVGNHAIFYAAHTPAERVYVFEPNPAARTVLEKNVALNGLDNVVMDFARYGLGKESANGSVFAPAHNLGAGRLVAEEDGEIEIRRLDDFNLKNVAFVKIDVEGMEIEVLDGAVATLRRNRAVLAVEVDPRNNGRFFAWCAEHRYHVIDAWRQHGPFDYLCVPGF